MNLSHEPTIDEIVTDPIMCALIRADHVTPDAFETLFRQAVSEARSTPAPLHSDPRPSLENAEELSISSVLQLRSASSGFREMVRTAENPVRKQELAARALELAQRAEAIAKWQEDPQRLHMSIERYRAMLRASIADPDQKQIVERTLRDAEQLAVSAKTLTLSRYRPRVTETLPRHAPTSP